MNATLGEPSYRDDAVPWDGVLLEYFSELSKLAAFPVDFTPGTFKFTWTSVASRAAYSSAWTAAVSDVGLGVADAGNPTPTPTPTPTPNPDPDH